jgi:hypothetical protein
MEDNMDIKATTIIEYAGLFVHSRTPEGFFVTTTHEGGVNAMPGATWFKTVVDALQAIDVFRAVDGDGQKFWHLLRAINRAHAAQGGPFDRATA